MLSHELDDVLYHLGEVFAVFGKKIPAGASRIWCQVFADREKTDCLRALDDYVQREKYAPKPCDIRTILEGYRTARGEVQQRVYRGCDPLTRRALQDDLRAQSKPADMRIASAWIHYHRELFRGPPPLHGIHEVNLVPLEREQWVEIINAEARRLNLPESLDPRYRLPEYWPTQGELPA